MERRTMEVRKQKVTAYGEGRAHQMNEKRRTGHSPCMHNTYICITLDKTVYTND